jgi:hypothetical protein
VHSRTPHERNTCQQAAGVRCSCLDAHPISIPLEHCPDTPRAATSAKDIPCGLHASVTPPWMKRSCTHKSCRLRVHNHRRHLIFARTQAVARGTSSCASRQKGDALVAAALKPPPLLIPTVTSWSTPLRQAVNYYPSLLPMTCVHLKGWLFLCAFV